MTELWHSPERAIARLHEHLKLNNNTLWYYAETKPHRLWHLHFFTITDIDSHIRPIDITSTMYLALGVKRDRDYLTLLWDGEIYELEQLITRTVGYPVFLECL